MLQQELEDNTDATGVLTAKETMLADMKQRFSHTSTCNNYYLATLLDPRFKCVFLDSVVVDKAKEDIGAMTARVREEPEEQPQPTVEEREILLVLDAEDIPRSRSPAKVSVMLCNVRLFLHLL